MGAIPSPYGDLYLSPAAAQAWNAMRSEALNVYGIDLYPGGPASAFRTYAQQAELYQAFLAGYGAPPTRPAARRTNTARPWTCPRSACAR